MNVLCFLLWLYYTSPHSFVSIYDSNKDFLCEIAKQTKKPLKLRNMMHVLLRNVENGQLAHGTDQKNNDAQYNRFSPMQKTREVFDAFYPSAARTQKQAVLPNIQKATQKDGCTAAFWVVRKLCY